MGHTSDDEQRTLWQAMKRWRRHLHSQPELAFEEKETAAFVADKLREWGIETHAGIGGTGVVGVIRGRLGPGLSLGLRADMDALPMQEQTGVEYRSTRDHVFHGCGHDGHTTILLGAARLLALQPDFHGTVHLIFQPAEETLTGGLAMMDDGLFDRYPCDEIYGLHNHPIKEPGTIGVRAGAILSACDLFRITVKGVGGHAASPHRCIDPVVVGAHLVQAVQTIASRSVNPLETAVVSICQFHAGTAINVISDSAVLEGTVRTLDRETQATVLKRLREICAGAQATFGGEVVFDHLQTSPPTVNAPGPAALVAEAGRNVLGTENVEDDVPPLMASEDFAYMLERRPGAYFFLGQGGPMCHHPQFDFNDDVAPIGVRMFLEIVRLRLGACGTAAT